MAGPSNIQQCREGARAWYEKRGTLPLLSHIAAAHSLTVREFGTIFGIKKSYACEILNERCFPPLELALKIACYFEVTVEELFGWRLEDTGERRPLLVIDPVTGQVVKLVGENRKDAITLAMEGSDGEKDCGAGRNAESGL